MGIFSFITRAMNEALETGFIEKMAELSKGDAQTSVFTNVRRIDDVFISEYAINEALLDDSPVWLLSDQGKILLCNPQSLTNNNNLIIPPVKGDYTLICDYNARQEDVRTNHFSYTRDPKIISNDIVAYTFNAENNILICSVSSDAVDRFKKILENRKKNRAPELSRITIEISRNNVFFSFRPLQSFIFSNYKIYIDGIKIGKIGNGESKILAMTAGQHELKLKNVFGLELSETVNFEIKQDQLLKFSCKYLPKAYIPIWFLLSKKVIELKKQT